METLELELAGYAFVALLWAEMSFWWLRRYLRPDSPKTILPQVFEALAILGAAGAIFVATLMRHHNAGMLHPDAGLGLRAGIAGGLAAAWYYRFRWRGR